MTMTQGFIQMLQRRGEIFVRLRGDDGPFLQSHDLPLLFSDGVTRDVIGNNRVGTGDPRVNKRRRDMVILGAFTETAGCVPFTPCAPGVLCISPNGESFANGHTWPFPVVANILLDEVDGSGWYAEFQQVMVDLLYQTPHYPASEVGDCVVAPFAWSMDDGGCQANTSGTGAIHYFPTAPLVEARLTVPAGAPALPAGIAIGWTTPAGIVGPSCPSDTNAPDGNESGEILMPPGANGYGLAGPQPVWSIWGLECGCIDGNGRFADIYRNQVIGCT